MLVVLLREAAGLADHTIRSPGQEMVVSALLRYGSVRISLEVAVSFVRLFHAHPT